MFQNSEGGAATRDADAPFGASGKVVLVGPEGRLVHRRRELVQLRLLIHLQLEL